MDLIGRVNFNCGLCARATNDIPRTYDPSTTSRHFGAETKMDKGKDHSQSSDEADDGNVICKQSSCIYVIPIINLLQIQE